MELSLSPCTTASWRRSSSASGRARSSSIVSWWVRSKDCGLLCLPGSVLTLRTTFTDKEHCAHCTSACGSSHEPVRIEDSVEFCSPSYSPNLVEGVISEVCMRHD